MGAIRYAYVGTYTPPQGTGHGIYVFRIVDGQWTQIQLIPTDSPSFLCFNSARDRLYAVNELSTVLDAEGTLSTFKVDSETGLLSVMSDVSTGGVWPCHLCLDKKEKHVFVANYKTGSVAVFPIDSDGGVTRRCDLLRFSGSSKHEVRQERPHSHYVNFCPLSKDEPLLQVVDLGLDRVFLYRFNEERGNLHNVPSAIWTVPAGAGARHIVVHNLFLYVINELDNTISVFRYDIDNQDRPLQNISTLPATFRGQSACSEIMVDSSGKFLYGANRGHDSIAIYKIDEGSGLLTLVEHQSTKGRVPRHFQIDEDFLYVGNQDSNSIVVFKIDSDTGKLIDIEKTIEVPSPVCIVFS